MNRPAKFDGIKRATNVTLPVKLVEEAKALGINMSQVCSDALNQSVSETKAEQWKRENRVAIESINAWVAENGMPYDEYRQY